MKKTMFTILLLISLFGCSFGQSNSNLHLGFHYFNLEDDKFAVDFINIGYQKDLSKRLNWDSNIGFIAYSRADKKPAIVYPGLVITDPNAYFNDFNQTSILKS